MRFYKAPLTLSIIIFNFIIFAFEQIYANGREIRLIFGLNPFIFNGLYFQFFSTAFLHSTLLHILMNMVILFDFGSKIERVFGSIYFGALYFVGMLCSSLASLAWVYYGAINDKFVNVVGASGAISALLGFVAYASPEQRKGLFVAILVMSFLPLLVGEKIAWYSHIAGFVGGYIFARIRL